MPSTPASKSKPATKTATTKAAPPRSASPPPMAPEPAFTPVGDMPPMQRNSGKAVAAMVIGIVACCIAIVPVVGSFLALPAGITALVLGILGVKEVNRDPSIKGKGMAVTGIVLGSIMIFLGILLIIAVTVGIGAIEDYCNENPDTEGCEEFNNSTHDPNQTPIARLAERVAALSWVPGPSFNDR